MQKAVKESVQTEHSPEFNQLIPAVIFAKRRDGERDKQKNECQNAGCAQKKLNRIGTDFPKQSVPAKQRKRHQAVDKNHDFVKPYVVHSILKR